VAAIITKIKGESKPNELNSMNKKLLTFWFYFTAFICFLCLIPLPLLLADNEKWHKHIYRLAKFWMGVFFKLNFLSIDVEYRFKLDKKQTYVFAPNHASYLDIPMMMYTVNQFFIFVGKSSISKTPLLGYVYKRMHITVDRDSARSKYSVLEKSKAAIRKNKSVLIFPEGGIFTQNPPQMTLFKEGAFRLAIEAQVPIVPVSMPYNWLVLPDKPLPPYHRHSLKVIFHEPIQTADMTLEDLPKLKQKVFGILDTSLRQQAKA
jgi:1-acyl-sn-glycerol-3-phosphate acyltransferase